MTRSFGKLLQQLCDRGVLRALRCTRLAGPTISVDPKLVEEVFSLAPHSLLHYLADMVDASRLKTPDSPMGEGSGR